MTEMSNKSRMHVIILIFEGRGETMGEQVNNQVEWICRAGDVTSSCAKGVVILRPIDYARVKLFGD